MPLFRVKKEVYEWITTGNKTIELRKGTQRKGDIVTFLNGKGKFVKGRILRKQEGKIEELLNTATYKRIIPTASNIDEAVAFIRQIYPSLEGPFTTYEFKLNQE